MKTSKIVNKAKKAMELGYTHMASVVRKYKATTYVHVVSCQTVIDNNGWLPASKHVNGWTGRIGISSKKINWNQTIRRDSNLLK